MGATIPFALVLCLNAVLLSATDQPICDVNNEVGDIARIELGYLDFSEDNELIWKHNKVNIFRRKRRQFITGKQEDIKNDGSLVLHSVTVDQSGPYSAEVFDDHGKQVYSAEKHLCVKEKVFKPNKPLVTCQAASSVQLNCSVKGSSLVQLRSKKVIKVMDMTGVLKLSEIKDADEFLCKRFSQHSDPVKVSCSGEKLLFGLNMNIMIAILAGGGGLFLVLVTVLVICCCHRHTQNKNRLSDEEELRLANVTQQQQQQQQQQQRQRHRQHQQRRQEQESYAVPHGQHQQQAAPRGHALPCPHSQNGDGPTPVPPRSRGKPRSKPPPVPAEDGADEQPPPRPRPRQSAPQHNR